MSQQSDINRANAQLSTGPRTPEGKAASSLNSTTHGLSVNRISRKNPEAQSRFEQRKQDYLAQYQPVETDRLQRDLIDTLAIARTRMELIEEAQDNLPDENAPEYANLQRYWRDADRTFSRTLKLLQQHRNQPATETRRQKETEARAQSQVNARQRIFLDAKRLEYSVLEEEMQRSNPQSIATLASFRQEIRGLLLQQL